MTFADANPGGLPPALAAAWAGAAPQFPAYFLLLPGSASFVCKAGACPVACCAIFSVPADEHDARRLALVSGLPRSAVLESENGEPIALPLVQPYLLARRDGACVLLRPGNLCGCYEGRPAACRLYPHQVLLTDRTGRPVPSSLAAGAVAMALAGEVGEALPLLLGHSGCPGFTGPPLSGEGWRALLAATARLQFTPAEGEAWPAAVAGQVPLPVVGP